ncbi:hypothetical protein V9W64_10685 [Neisseria leonii]|uniref:Uncharacterized protein n=2 Tax=Neisseria leonii TaxID=2995413 RepID=A0AAQ3V0C5_9NEIS
MEKFIWPTQEEISLLGENELGRFMNLRKIVRGIYARPDKWIPLHVPGHVRSLLHMGYGLGSAMVLHDMLPRFMSPVADRYAAALDKLTKADAGEWRAAVALAAHEPESGSDSVLDAYRLVQHLPHISVDDGAKIAYCTEDYWTGRKGCARTTIGRYAKRHHGVSESDLALIQRAHDLRTGRFDGLVRFVENGDAEGWREVYRSRNIRSCMNNTSYGCTELDTSRCYASSAFGLPDNGLRLAYIPHAGDGRTGAVARAIVHEPSKTYFKVYGDDALSAALEQMGYEFESDGIPDGTVLWAGGEMLFPYVDGCGKKAYHCWSDEAGCGYWVMADCGDYDLQDTAGSKAFRKELCDDCGDTVDDGDTYRTWDGNGFTQVCYDCLSDYTVVEAVTDNGLESVYVLSRDAVAIRTGSGLQLIYDDEATRLEFGAVRSDYDSEYIAESCAVYLEKDEDYVWEGSDDIVWLEYAGTYALRDYCREFDGVWVHDSDWEHFGSAEVPVEGLSQELDGIRERILYGSEVETEA